MLRLRVQASTDDAESLVLAVVARKLEAADVVEWAAVRLVSYEAPRG